MGRLRRLLPVATFAICLAADGIRAFANDEDSIQKVLAAGQEAMLERHYGQAVHILRNGLKDHPEDNRLRLELGRAYLSRGSDGRAIRLFRQILSVEPNNRLARLELARALSYGRQYKDSDQNLQGTAKRERGGRGSCDRTGEQPASSTTIRRSTGSRRQGPDISFQ